MIWVLGLAVAYITVVSWIACLLKAAAFADTNIAEATARQTEGRPRTQHSNKGSQAMTQVDLS